MQMNMADSPTKNGQRGMQQQDTKEETGTRTEQHGEVSLFAGK